MEPREGGPAPLPGQRETTVAARPAWASTVDRVKALEARLLEDSENSDWDDVIDGLTELGRMTIGIEDLTESSIGRTVSSLKKVDNEPVVKLAKHLIKKWKTIVNAEEASGGGGALEHDTGAPAKRVQGATPQLLELWSRADLADAVVEFLPAKAIARLSVVAKPLREAQARVVLAAARRRNRSEAVTRATFQALEAGESSHFRETWSDGRARWNFYGALGLPCPNLGAWGFEQGHGYDFGIVERENTPPRLLIARNEPEPVNVRRGLTCQFSEVGRRVVRFRVQVSIDASFMNPYPRNFEVGCAAITGSNAAQIRPGFDNFFGTDFGIGICFVKDDPEGYRGTGVSLKWFSNCNYSTLVQDVTEALYTVDASFLYYGRAYTVAMARVSVNGGNPVWVQCDSSPVNFVHLYSQDRGMVRYGEIDVWYEPATPYGTGSYQSSWSASAMAITPGRDD